jgi:biopolymer transport protein ExbB
MVRREKVRPATGRHSLHSAPLEESNRLIGINPEIAAVFVEISDSAGRTGAMRRGKTTRTAVIRAVASALALVVAVSPRAQAQDPQGENPSRRDATRLIDHSAHVTSSPPSSGGDELRRVAAHVERIARGVMAWYRRTPPAERVTWGGMIACGLLGVLVILERLLKLRHRKIMPRAFTARFLDRLHDGKLDCGQALDLCELNPSPAADVALAAVRRWGRPAGDLERAVALALRVETERLRRNVGTLRRIAVLTPLLGVLGTLFALERALQSVAAQPVAWGPALAANLAPLLAGIVIATLSLIAYDALLIRIEKLAGGLDRLGAETIDAIAVAAPHSSPTLPLAHGELRPAHLRPDAGRTGPAATARHPHQSYFRLDDGSGMIGHPGERSMG